MRRMTLALIGTRGVPARYGGFETGAEEIGKRLVRRGHKVWVYCRTGYSGAALREFEGMRLVHLPALPIKFLETLSHTALSLLHAAFRSFDALLVFNSANSFLVILPRLLGKNIVLHTDGLEWMREKWSGLGQTYYRLAEKVAAKSSVPLISDSAEIQKHYLRSYGRESHYIAYGAALEESHSPELLERFGLQPGDYFLQIARFEPENNILLSVRAFEMVETSKKLALVGGTKYRSNYAAEVRASSDPRVRFLGFCYDADVRRELLCNAYAYIHGNEAGGTNPGLLQAMGAGCFIVARDVAFNREVCGETAVYFPKDADRLRDLLQWTIGHSAELECMKEKSRQIIKDRYDWDTVTTDYERVFETISNRAEIRSLSPRIGRDA
jgi:glycosyltransferase involved in cell wall biosynthesis